MNASAELWLMLLAAGLYLVDSLLLLRHDELLLTQSVPPRWRAAFGANGWKMAGKEPLLLNPLAPWQCVARVRWQLEAGLADGPVAAVVLPRVGLVPRLGVVLLWGLMFAALPLCLFSGYSSVLTLAVIAALYVGIAVVLASLRRDWLAQGLESRRFWLMALECVACPPFGVNAVRRVSLLLPARIALCQIAQQEEAQGRLDALKRQLQLRVNEQIDAQPEGSARLPALQATARSLEVEADS